MDAGRKISKILFAVDFSEATPPVAAVARTLAEQLGAEVLCLYVSPLMNNYAQLYVAPQMIDDLEAEIKAGAEKSMNEVVRTNFPGLKVSGRVVMGYPPETIIEVAEAEDVDLIIMGTHGRKGVDRIIFGSVAEKVVKSSKIPVLTIRPV